jgi:hypothetical protein
MRNAVGVGALLALLLPASSAAAADAPWCLAHVDRSGVIECAYATFQECLESSRGVGGFCQPNYNTRYTQQDRPRRQPRSR